MHSNLLRCRSCLVAGTFTQLEEGVFVGTEPTSASVPPCNCNLLSLPPGLFRCHLGDLGATWAVEGVWILRDRTRDILNCTLFNRRTKWGILELGVQCCTAIKRNWRHAIGQRGTMVKNSVSSEILPADSRKHWMTEHVGNHECLFCRHESAHPQSDCSDEGHHECLFCRHETDHPQSDCDARNSNAAFPGNRCVSTNVWLSSRNAIRGCCRKCKS